MPDNHQKKILAVSDQVGFGKVALPAQIPVLTGMGYQVFNLPTCYVSNNFNYGKHTLHDMTSVLEPTLKVWDELGFTYDAVALGYLLNNEQLELIEAFVGKHRAEREAKGLRFTVFMDPIMGDNGELYQGNTMERVTIVREMTKSADYLTPNATEATFLAEKYVGQIEFTATEAKDLAVTLHELSGATCIVTSINIDHKESIIIYDGKSYEVYPYLEIPDTKYAGTGDIFAALLLGKIMQEMPLAQAVIETADTITKLIRHYIKTYELNHGIPVELALKELDLI